MVEKYRGILPPGSIWFHLKGNEVRALVETNPEIKAQFPKDKPITEIENADFQALPGQTERIENMLKAAGLTIVTLQD